MGEPGDVDIHPRGRPAGAGQCPYCHFALKGSNIVSCPSCGAGHHAECWEENGGCAVLGCAAVAIAARPPAPPSVPPPPPAPGAPARSSSAVVAVVLAVVAIAGAVVAVALTRNSTPIVAGESVTTPGSETSGGESTTTEEPDDGRLVVGSSYAVRIPAGFETESSGVYHQATAPGENSYTESQWRSTEEADTEIHIDYTTQFDSTQENAARGVRSRRNKPPSFREYSFGAYTRENGTEAWRWHFSTVEKGVELHRVAYYMAGCNTGYALLGVTPDSAWQRLSDVFAAAAKSLRPRC